MDGAFQILQGCEKGDGAMAFVVVSGGFDLAYSKGQPGLGALKGLALALFVAAQNQSFLRWVEIQPNDIPKLHFKIWIIAVTVKGVDRF